MAGENRKEGVGRYNEEDDFSTCCDVVVNEAATLAVAKRLKGLG